MFSSNSLQAFFIFVTGFLLAFTVDYCLKGPSTPLETSSLHMSTPLKQAIKSTMSTLKHAKIVHRASASRGHSDHGWLNTYHSFSFADWYDPRFESFGSIRVLNEDRVAPKTGFPTHPHRDAEIFSYILSGELTHRDSMQKAGSESSNKELFYRMKRGDVQFTTGGSGIAHSEQNEHKSDTVHFLQIWALPWKRGLKPVYHTNTFPEEDKRKGFVHIISPLKAGKNASAQEEAAAVPAINGSIPVHADLVFSAGVIAPGKSFGYKVGADAAQSQLSRKIYVHLPMTKDGKSQVKIDERSDVVLKEGDGAFVSEVNAGDVLNFESVGSADAEVIILDSN